ncbi:MAG: DNA polymerase III subunit chi [Syntrophobacteraceae bacterium]|jgi:DNA polymerase-3 subunit chi|nr:DNA polymerase III subunit chi [Syntrophobacteraceae bacterium]
MLYFMETKAAEQRILLCQWVDFFHESEKKVQVLADSTLAAQHLDGMLWTFSQPSFIPHRILSAEGSEDGEESVVISVGEVFMSGWDVLICDGPAGLELMGRYPVALHFIIQNEPERLQSSRILWQQARDRGMGIQHIPYAFNHPRFGWPPSDRTAGSAQRSK